MDFSVFVRIPAWLIGMGLVFVEKEVTILLNNALNVLVSAVHVNYSLMIFYALVAIKI